MLLLLSWLQALAAENVSLENQLLDAKSSQLRHEKQAGAAAAATAKLEAQLAKLSQHGDESSAELAALTSERRILKARLMQAEARMRAAGLEPLPPLSSKGRLFSGVWGETCVGGGCVLVRGVRCVWGGRMLRGIRHEGCQPGTLPPMCAHVSQGRWVRG